MPYIFHTNHGFILIDSSYKNGVFCQNFNNGHYTKPSSIYPHPISDFSAHITPNGKLYIYLPQLQAIRPLHLNILVMLLPLKQLNKPL